MPSLSSHRKRIMLLSASATLPDATLLRSGSRGEPGPTGTENDSPVPVTTAAPAGGDMYCKDGVTHMSAGLLAASLKANGTEITVPDRLSGVDMTTESRPGCDGYFSRTPSGPFAPDKDTNVMGVQARAIVAAAGTTSDTYFVSAKDPARLLKLESVRDGRTSSTTYVDFAKKKDVTLPSPDEAMTMEQFRTAVDAE
ncbi:hypothetical protein AB0L75_21765 [Streptomyces sp. NPDC052101]|uniref:hypothetical protein n=1 Tax=Streptomyces sp. NPDC052101 TaxID=3155763 RepID=UPI0034321DC8